MYMHNLVNDIETEKLRKENENLKELVDKLRIFKHDYCNVIASISGYIALNDMSGLKKFVESIMNEINEVNQLQSINMDTINEPSIFSLISSKYRLAISNNVAFNFFSNINYQELNMGIYEFSKILGILLDNAIDAAKNSSEREVFVNFEVSKGLVQTVTIKNSYSNKDIDIKSIFNKGFSTKKIKSGIGLWEVKEIVKRYPKAKINTSKDDEFFIQKLVLKK